MDHDVNKIVLIGVVAAEPDMRFVREGVPATGFCIASEQSGGRLDHFEIVAWAKLAETCNELLVTGTRIMIEGSLHTRHWQDAGGEHQTMLVVASEMILLSRRGELVSVAPPPHERPPLPTTLPAGVVPLTTARRPAAAPPPTPPPPPALPARTISRGAPIQERIAAARRARDESAPATTGPNRSRWPR